jgi:hypothetical protein
MLDLLACLVFFVPLVVHKHSAVVLESNTLIGERQTAEATRRVQANAVFMGTYPAAHNSPPRYFEQHDQAPKVRGFAGPRALRAPPCGNQGKAHSLRLRLLRGTARGEWIELPKSGSFARQSIRYVYICLDIIFGRACTPWHPLTPFRCGGALASTN